MVFFQRPHLQSGASVLQALLVRDRSKNPEAEQGGQGRARVPLPLGHWEALGGQPRVPLCPGGVAWVERELKWKSRMGTSFLMSLFLSCGFCEVNHSACQALQSHPCLCLTEGRHRTAKPRCHFGASREEDTAQELLPFSLY